MKPLALLEYLVRMTEMPNPEQIYLDPFMGTGTTIMAVKKAGKGYIGIEIEKEYYDIAVSRVKKTGFIKRWW